MLNNLVEANRGERRFAGMEVLLIEQAGMDMVDELIPSPESDRSWETVSVPGSEKKLPSPPAEGEGGETQTWRAW